MDILESQNKLDFVREQMSMYAGEKRPTSNGFMILCPFHSEKTPSGSINLNTKYPPGFFRCFGCGAKASWDKLAPAIGLNPYKRGKPETEYAHAVPLRIEDQDLNEKEFREDEFEFYDLPPNKKWRGFSTNFLLELEGRLCRKWNAEYQCWSREKFIYLPVKVKKKTRGYFLARLKKDPEGKRPSYVLAASVNNSQWSKRYGLWPFDYSLKMMKDLSINTIVLVEGQRDALRLISESIPAMCIFGTNSWSDNKARLLEQAGTERLILMFDGDVAGIKASLAIKPQVEPYFEVLMFKLWKMEGSPYLKYRHKKEPGKAAKLDGVDLWDPGNAPDFVIEKLKRLL